MNKDTQYRCPLCKHSLSLIGKVFTCINNHSFDLAKEGYVNLLPVQFKHSKEPGDNKAMVNARRAFLEKDHYLPLVTRLIEIYQQYGDQSGQLFDAGSGEGYYTHQHKTESNTVYGIDISKEAVKKAAKKYQTCHFSVGTLSQLPFENELFDWLVSIYAPILETEFTRVMRPNAYLITVTPAQMHLTELKEKIYNEVKEHDSEKTAIEHLNLVHQENLSYKMDLATGDDVLNLLSMTPFAFKATESIKQQLANTEHFNCQADFQIRLYQKTHK